MEAYKWALKVGKMTESQRKGIITLIPKANRDLAYIKNWRPIVLLNTSFKILAKVYATRIKKVLPDIIHKNQSGFLSGRNITDNLRTILDVIDYTELHEVPAILVTVDFEKAFDKVRYDSLFEIMKWFNFGPVYINAIRTLFEDFRLATINNGYQSEYIKPQKGLFQGNPIASYLFILVIELLAIRLRQNARIKGVKIGLEEILLSLFADDLCLLMQYNQNSWEATTNEFKRFEEMTGMVINYGKSTVYRIGSLKDSEAKFYTQNRLNWSNEPILVLGIHISTDRKQMLDMNFSPLLQKAQATLQLWKRRGLSLFGKIQIVNSLIASLFVYRLAVLPTPSDSYFKKLKVIINDFIWNERKAKIKYEILIGRKDQGGAGLACIRKKNDASKMSWINKVKTNLQTRTLCESILGIKLGKMIEHINLSRKDICYILPNLDCTIFWHDVVRTWVSMSHEKPNSKDEILKESLWWNSNIKIGNKPIFWQRCYDSDIRFIRDIWNEDKKEFYSLEEINQKYGPDINFIQYHGIKQAISKEWVQELGQNKNEKEHTDIRELLHSTKLLYRRCVGNEKLVIMKYQKWKKEIEGLKMEYDDFVRRIININKTTISVKLRSFQYRLLVFAIITNVHMFYYKIRENKLCTFCNNYDETIKHLFFECKKVELIWRKISQLINKGIDLRYETIVFNSVTQRDNAVENCILLITKHYIYRSRCLNERLSYEACKKYIKEYHDIEEQIAYQKDKHQLHALKWSHVNFD